MKNLADKALLVNIRISQWNAHKLDKDITREIEKTHQAHRAGRFNKNLIDETELLDIQKTANATRKMLYTHSLPWGDNGDRLLPASNYFEFLKEFGSCRDRFYECVKHFIGKYPELKKEAKSRLNGMYKEQDYPSVDDMERKFSMEKTFMMISNLSDFRLNIDRTEVDSVRKDIEKELSHRISEATREIYLRIKEVVEHMSKRLGDKDAVFRDSLVSNIEALIDTLPRLNFTNDEKINELIEDMKSLVVNPDILRNNNKIRKAKAYEAETICEKITAFLSR